MKVTLSLLNFSSVICKIDKKHHTETSEYGNGVRWAGRREREGGREGNIHARNRVNEGQVQQVQQQSLVSHPSLTRHRQDNGTKSTRHTGTHVSCSVIYLQVSYTANKPSLLSCVRETDRYCIVARHDNTPHLIVLYCIVLDWIGLDCIQSPLT